MAHGTFFFFLWRYLEDLALRPLVLNLISFSFQEWEILKYSKSVCYSMYYKGSNAYAWLFSKNRLRCWCLPKLVARDGHVVNVFGEIEWRCQRVSLVVEGPICFGTVIVESEKYIVFFVNNTENQFYDVMVKTNYMVK